MRSKPGTMGLFWVVYKYMANICATSTWSGDRDPEYGILSTDCPRICGKFFKLGTWKAKTQSHLNGQSLDSPGTASPQEM